ncbi:MAG: nitrate/nitrite transporter NrtS [Gammaproteobacteria bacterium]|nr:nitrate/nitrite transporter NrtS [Gammaproteobacteria bacterium]
MREWLEIAFRRSVCVRAVKVGLLVGTILMVINHGDALLNGSVSAATALKIFLTYLVPYMVSTYASVCVIRQPN